MRILVKNSDKLYSKLHKTKLVDEYLVYVLNTNDIPLEAEVVYGASDKNKTIDKYLKKYFNGENDIDEIVEEITFEEFKNQFKNG